MALSIHVVKSLNVLVILIMIGQDQLMEEEAQRVIVSILNQGCSLGVQSIVEEELEIENAFRKDCAC